MTFNFTNGTGNNDTTPGAGDFHIYGILSNCLFLAPTILATIQTVVTMTDSDVTGYIKYHKQYIAMLAASYGPLAIMYWIILLFDSEAARYAGRGALELAGLGPTILLWVGLANFM